MLGRPRGCQNRCEVTAIGDRPHKRFSCLCGPAFKPVSTGKETRCCVFQHRDEFHYKAVGAMREIEEASEFEAVETNGSRQISSTFWRWLPECKRSFEEYGFGVAARGATWCGRSRSRKSGSHTVILRRAGFGGSRLRAAVRRAGEVHERCSVGRTTVCCSPPLHRRPRRWTGTARGTPPGCAQEHGRRRRVVPVPIWTPHTGNVPY